MLGSPRETDAEAPSKNPNLLAPVKTVVQPTWPANIRSNTKSSLNQSILNPIHIVLARYPGLRFSYIHIEKKHMQTSVFEPAV